MKRFQLTERADRELSEIFRYTTERYGRRQAETYAAKLLQRLERAMTTPALIRPCDDILPSLLLVRAESHVAYGKLDADVFVVLAVLHQSMDPSRHLADHDDDDD